MKLTREDLEKVIAYLKILAEIEANIKDKV